MSLSVGQTLWFVPADLRYTQPREVTLTGVGRRWATFKIPGREVRIEKTTLREEGNNSGRCYLSRAEWDAQQARIAAWTELRRKGYLLPIHAHLISLQNFARLGDLAQSRA